MARSSLEERLEKLQEQKRQIEEQERSLRSRVSQERRKAEIRERILLGAFLLHQLGRNDPSVQPVREWVAKELPGFLTKPRDRETLAAILSELQKGKPLPASGFDAPNEGHD